MSYPTDRQARSSKRHQPARRPPWVLLAVGLACEVLAAIRVARFHDLLGWTCVLAGAICLAVYVDLALRWLRDRP